MENITTKSVTASPTPKATRSREDLDSRESAHSGILGIYERLLRRNKELMSGLTFGTMYLFGAALLGLSFTPGVILFELLSKWTQDSPIFLRWPALGIAIGAGYFLYGFTGMIVFSLANLPIRRFLKPMRGSYYSAQFVPWYLHNGFTYALRYTFLEMVTPSPFNILFFRLMGMKVGKAVQINSTHISDPGMIVLEDRVTIGGSATLIAHYGMGGYLILAPLIIRKGATIGLKAIVMGGAEIGEGATILANSVILPKTKVPAGETWGGVPARKIDLNKS